MLHFTLKASDRNLIYVNAHSSVILHFLFQAKTSFSEMRENKDSNCVHLVNLWIPSKWINLYTEPFTIIDRSSQEPMLIRNNFEELRFRGALLRSKIPKRLTNVFPIESSTRSLKRLRNSSKLSYPKETTVISCQFFQNVI